MTCVFCKRVSKLDVELSMGNPGKPHGTSQHVVAFAPLDPVVSGHMLFLPANHTEHQTLDAPAALAATMGWAEQFAMTQRVNYNLITSSGSAATQTVAHIHVHYVPRRPNDGLELPWTSQQRARSAETRAG